MERTRIAVIGGCRLFRDGLGQMLRNSGFTSIVEGRDWREVLQALASEPAPDVIVLACAGADDVCAQLEAIETAPPRPESRLVLITDVTDGALLRQALDRGVYALLSSDTSAAVLHLTLQLVLLDQKLAPGWLMQAAENRAMPSKVLALSPPQLHGTERLATTAFARATPASAGLSDRERQILRFLIRGSSNKMIARDLNLTEATVKVHVKAVLRKIRVANRTQAAIWALNSGVLEAPTVAKPPQLTPVEAEPRKIAV